MSKNNKAEWTTCAANIAATVLAAHADEVDRDGRWPEESIAALAEAGLLGLTVPETHGGAGQGAAAFAGVITTLAEACASTAMIYLMHICGTQVIAAAASLIGRDDILRNIAAGNHLTTLAFSEKGSRSHFWMPLSKAEKTGNDYLLTTEKSWVTSAGHAQSYIVSTKAADNSEPMASTLYFVPAAAPGLTVSGAWDGLGLRGNASAPLRLNKVRVPAAQKVSAEGEGFACMMSTVLPWFQLGSAAVSVGIARAATASTKQHLLSSRFEHLNQTLASLMNLRARLGQMQTLTDTNQAFVASVATLMDSPDPVDLGKILECKAAAAETALQVTDLAMRTCGGAAFSKHLSVERNFRDARAGAVMAPTTDVLYDLIARSMLGMPLLD